VLLRSLAVWLLILCLAVANGAFREAVLVRKWNAAQAHFISTVILCVLIFIATFILIDWIDPRSARDALRIGLLWLVLTVAFEFALGRLIVKKSWAELLADYNLLTGRVWILVPATVAIAPLLMALTRGII
jgi:hypothetical protein